MVDRRILWTLLQRQFGMPVSLIRLLRSVFDDNFSKLDILGEKSDKIRHLRGLPQGSSLSPILFNFFIDSFIRKIQKENLMMDFNGFRTNNLFFADDGNIHSNEAEVVQNILDLASDWESEFGMKFSPSKCLVLSLRIAFLQECLNCNRETLSRKHPTLCSGIDGRCGFTSFFRIHYVTSSEFFNFPCEF